MLDSEAWEYSAAEMTGEDQLARLRTILRPRVEAGAAQLDVSFGPCGWANEVDLHELNMGSCGRCIVGQLTKPKGTSFDQWHRLGMVSGFWPDRLDELGLDDQDDERLGLEVPNVMHMHPRLGERGYYVLGKLWAAQVRARQEEH